jgi:hypothetical protein
MSEKKKEKSTKKKDKPEKEKSIFHKKSDAGKGDKIRRGITQDAWGKKWETIFDKKEKFISTFESSNEDSET